jgi:hypothetical protein
MTTERFVCTLHVLQLEQHGPEHAIPDVCPRRLQGLQYPSYEVKSGGWYQRLLLLGANVCFVIPSLCVMYRKNEGWMLSADVGMDNRLGSIVHHPQAS